MQLEDRNRITKKILEMETLRPISRIERLKKAPIRTFFYYILATLGHIKPYRLTFKTLWGEKMTSYLPEGNTFYYYGYCEANLTNFLLKIIKKGDVVIDVGAHIGFYTMLFAELVETNGEVHGFEPTPWTFELLKKNTRQYSNVLLNNNAVSDKQESISFKDYGPGFGAYNTASALGSTLKKNSKTIYTNTVVLDTYCKEKAIKPVLIKLDAEGYEYAILRGMKDVLKNIRPLITLEVAGGVEWETNCMKSIRYLMDFDYQPFEITLDGTIAPHEIKNNYIYDNIIFVPNEKINTYYDIR